MLHKIILAAPVSSYIHNTKSIEVIDFEGSEKIKLYYMYKGIGYRVIADMKYSSNKNIFLAVMVCLKI